MQSKTLTSQKPVIIAPSLLSANFANLEADVKKLEEAKADWLHFDVMDGTFVPNISIGIPVLKSLRKITKLPIDAHLMIQNPDHMLKPFADAGADIITVQAEACTHLHRTLQAIRTLGCKVGLALNPHSSSDCLEYVVELLDFVLVMTVNPGFGGQKFIDACLGKIAKIHQTYPELDIQVDGGIKLDNISIPSAKGANIFVAGSGIFQTPNWNETIENMRISAQNAR